MADKSDEIWKDFRNSEIVDRAPEMQIIHSAKRVWKMELTDGFYIMFDEKRKPPSAFHRWMHRVFFGFKWSRVDE